MTARCQSETSLPETESNQIQYSHIERIVDAAIDMEPFSLSTYTANNSLTFAVVDLPVQHKRILTTFYHIPWNHLISLFEL